ncbi:MAG: hypothetical protein GEU98_22110 [Pseudonocardiaceae bacterium]|nr:hypothetical protein [Pseudonocardiaceae bacterium]
MKTIKNVGIPGYLRSGGFGMSGAQRVDSKAIRVNARAARMREVHPILLGQVVADHVRVVPTQPNAVPPSRYMRGVYGP